MSMTLLLSEMLGVLFVDKVSFPALTSSEPFSTLRFNIGFQQEAISPRKEFDEKPLLWRT